MWPNTAPDREDLGSWGGGILGLLGAQIPEGFLLLRKGEPPASGIRLRWLCEGPAEWDGTDASVTVLPVVVRDNWREALAPAITTLLKGLAADGR